MPGALTHDPTPPGGSLSTFRGAQNPTVEPGAGAVSGAGISATNGATVTTALAAAVSSPGQRVVSLAPGQTVAVTKPTATAANQRGGIELSPGVSFDGNGSLLRCDENCAYLSYINMDDDYAFTDSRAQVTTNVTAGQRHLVVSNPALFSVGQTVLFRLGDVASDTAECSYFGFAEVESKSGSSIYLNTAFSRAVNVGSITNAANKALYAVAPLAGVSIGNFRCEQGGSGNAEELAFVRFGRNILFHNIHATNIGAGLFLQYSENCTIDGLTVAGCDDGGQASKGRALNVAESRGIVLQNFRLADLDGCAAFVEAESTVKLRDGQISLGLTYDSGSVFGVIQNSRLDVENVTITGKGGHLMFDDGGTGGRITYRDSIIDLATEPLYLGDSGSASFAGTLDLSIAGVRELYDINNAYTCEIDVPVVNSMYLYSYIADGLLLSAEVYVSPTWLAGDTSAIAVYLGRRSYDDATGDNGNNLATYLTAGRWVDVPIAYGSNAGILWTTRNLPLKLLVASPSSGYDGSKHVKLRVKVARNIA